MPLHPHRAGQLADSVGRAAAAWSSGNFPRARRLLLAVEQECSTAGVRSSQVAFGLAGVARIERNVSSLMSWTSTMISRDPLSPSSHAQVRRSRHALETWLHQPMYRRSPLDAAAVRSWLGSVGAGVPR